MGDQAQKLEICKLWFAEQSKRFKEPTFAVVKVELDPQKADK